MNSTEGSLDELSSSSKPIRLNESEDPLLAWTHRSGLKSKTVILGFIEESKKRDAVLV